MLPLLSWTVFDINIMNNASTPPSAKAITTPDYWEDVWAYSDVPDAIDPSNNSPENYIYQYLHKLFEKTLGLDRPVGAKLIEIGCGGSRWLPYFKLTFGYDVTGIDYTEAGVRLAHAVLDKAGVNGSIIQGNLFDPPPNCIGQFDVLVSFGVLEHFEDTAQVACACARYLRPGGRMITLVPTMQGLYGWAYRLLRPAIYRKHLPQSRESLAKAHADADLEVNYCDYVLGFPGIISAPTSSKLNGRMAYAASCFYWKLERRGLGLPPNRWTSPYALCIATKSGATNS